MLSIHSTWIISHSLSCQHSSGRRHSKSLWNTNAFIWNWGGKWSVHTNKQEHRQTCVQCSHASVGVAQARSNNHQHLQSSIWCLNIQCIYTGAYIMHARTHAHTHARTHACTHAHTPWWYCPWVRWLSSYRHTADSRLPCCSHCGTRYESVNDGHSSS